MIFMHTMIFFHIVTFDTLSIPDAKRKLGDDSPALFGHFFPAEITRQVCISFAAKGDII